MTMQEGIDISFWCSHPKLLDAVSKETLSCDSKSDGIFIVYYPEDGGFIPESTCYPSFHEDNVCSIFQGKMVLISKSALKSNKRNEDMAIIHDFMNNLADPDSNNIYSSQSEVKYTCRRQICDCIINITWYFGLTFRRNSPMEETQTFKVTIGITVSH
jgi:hypothetical protein